MQFYSILQYVCFFSRFKMQKKHKYDRKLEHNCLKLTLNPVWLYIELLADEIWKEDLRDWCYLTVQSERMSKEDIILLKRKSKEMVPLCEGH